MTKHILFKEEDDSNIRVTLEYFGSTGNVRLSVYDSEAQELITYYEIPQQIGRKLKRVFKDS